MAFRYLDVQGEGIVVGGRYPTLGLCAKLLDLVFRICMGSGHLCGSFGTSPPCETMQEP